MDFEKIIEERNGKNVFARSLGMRVTRMDVGMSESEMPVTENHMNPIGSVHGGVLYTLADVTAGAAPISYGDMMTTVDASFHYLNPGLNVACLHGKGKVIKKGKRVAVVDVDILDEKDTVLATGIFTFMTIPNRADASGNK